MDRAIAKHGVLDRAEGDAGQAASDMGAAHDGHPATVRDDLHQRFPRHRQLFDA
jgi:hypothetical protein